MANGIKTDLPFTLENASPLDTKTYFETIAEMKAFDTRFLSDVAYAVNKETGSLYIYNATNDDDPDLGKWRVVKATTIDTVEKDKTEGVSSKGVYEALYTTIPETQDAYIKVEGASVSGALEVVDDATVSPTSTQIKVSDVTPVRDALYTPSIGDFVVLELGVAEHDVTTYMPRTETYTKDEINKKIGENAGATTEEIKVVGVEGIGYEDGDIIPENTPFMDIFKKALTRVIHPDYVAPTMTLTANKVLVEKGVATDIVLTPAFVQNDAGAINGYKVFKADVEIDNQTTTSTAPYTDTGATITTNTVYKYEISYDGTAVLKQNNLGEDDPTGKIEAGSIFKTVTVKPVMATYVGVVDNGNVDETNITTLCTKLIRENQTLTQKMTAVFQTIVFATTGTLTSIINQNNYEVISSFVKSTVSIGGVNYNVYALEDVNVSNFGYTFKF